ncbi:MAG: gliding motility-associated C-terminal domain-containing protein [Sphingobacteriaceae bacterium]|nr:MAG: gliding motility-associated C-terminal domain-containing protein [Sphingobacteriaceae bacterium]
MYFTKFSGYKRSIRIFITIASILNFSASVYSQNLPAATIVFPLQKIYTGSAVQSFTIRGSHLNASVTVSTNPPFFISKDSVIFHANISFDTTELASNQTVYVKFKPTAIGNYADSIVNISAGADSKIVALTGKSSSGRTNSYNNHLAANNVITPNGDGRNDTWVIKNIEQYPNNTVKVMDKSGNVIYNARGYNNNWDGTYNNGPLAQGTYYYIVDFGEGEDLVFKGFITIVRD